MSLEENKRAARRIFEDLWSCADYRVIEEIIAEDCVLHVPYPAEVIPVKSVYKERVRAEREALPDLHISVEDQIAEGDKVVTRWILRGTHTKKFLGLEPTGKKTEHMGITIFRFEAGKIKEIWLVGDELGWISQMGLKLPAEFVRLDPREPSAGI